MKDVFTPFFPCSLAELTEYLQRVKVQEDVDPARIIRAGNHAIAYAENRTARRLVARTYREPVSIASCVVTAADATVTGAGFDDLYVGDEVVGSGLDIGSRVASITSDAALELDRPALTTVDPATLTFGSARLRVDGTGSTRLQIPEWPVQALYSAVWVDSDGTETALDLTGYRLESATGSLILPNDTFPEGEMNVLVACEAGYREPTATRRGDFAKWTALQRVCLRLAQVFFQDEQRNPGRIVDRSLGQVTSQLPSFKVPDDIESELEQFMRVG